MNEQKPQSKASQFAEKLLVGIVESIARAATKAAESITSDARKALQREAAKVEVIEQGIGAWRKNTLGEIDDDLPDSLRGSGKDNVQ